VTADDEVQTLYRQLLAAWNNRDAYAMAALFTEQGNIVGFDGSQVDGRAAIEATMAQIFANHMTAMYVAKVREVRSLSPEVTLLRAVVGMIQPGTSELNPAVNAIQSLVAVRHNGAWQVELFQNTPAQFHGRPELAASLTEELRQLIPAG
jgi:uncharacterized protein (TIGR02246 family)